MKLINKVTEFFKVQKRIRSVHAQVDRMLTSKLLNEQSSLNCRSIKTMLEDLKR